MKCVGGVIQGRLWPKDDEERQRAIDAGHDLDPDHILPPTTGHRRRSLLRRQRHHRRDDAGHSLPRPRSDVTVAGHALAQGTVRLISSEHRFEKPHRL
jgi:hypothetical protein